VYSPLGRDPAFLLELEAFGMFSMAMSTHSYGGHVVIALYGELDVADAADFATALAEVVAARAPGIIVDLGGLEFIDSSGVAALARGRKLARHAGGDLLLAAPRRGVRRVLTLTRLIDVFPVHASVHEAVGHARRTAAAMAGRAGPVGPVGPIGPVAPAVAT
jgi:anti-sigma B factor antagonist